MKLQYTTYPVQGELRHWVRYFWSYDCRDSKEMPLHIRSFADKYPRLVFQDHRFAAIRNGDYTPMPDCYISGPDTRPTDAFWTTCFSHFGASLYPHALHTFFNIDAAELTNQVYDILFLDKTNIPSLLRDAASHTERVRLLHHYFEASIKKHRTDAIIREILSSAAGGVIEAPSSLARQYKISERQLQRRFRSSTGLSPACFRRIHKFEKALAMLPGTGYGMLTQLAYELGYSDQSHFIKDFTGFSGLTPYAFISNINLGAESSSFIYTG